MKRRYRLSGYPSSSVDVLGNYIHIIIIIIVVVFIVTIITIIRFYERKRELYVDVLCIIKAGILFHECKSIDRWFLKGK